MYIIDRTELRKEKEANRGMIFLGTFFAILIFICIIDEDIDIAFGDFLNYIAVFVIMLFCLWFGIKGIKNTKKKEKLYDYLEMNGKLIKNLPYKSEFVTSEPNKIGEIKIVIECEVEPEVIVKLIGDKKDRDRCIDKDTVNVLIDPENPEKYVIDAPILEYKSYYSANEVIDY